MEVGKSIEIRNREGRYDGVLRMISHNFLSAKVHVIPHLIKSLNDFFEGALFISDNNLLTT